jgi:HSP20 family molecular chaperone IbpA
MIREFGRSIGNAVLEGVGRASSRVQERKPLPVDLLESDDAFLAVFDAPGATSSDVQVNFSNNEIQVRIDRFREFYEDADMRYPGRGLALDGHVAIPDGIQVDPNEATATLTARGTLEVEVPKADEDADSIDVTDEDEETTVETESEEEADADDENGDVDVDES